MFRFFQGQHLSYKHNLTAQAVSMCLCGAFTAVEKKQKTNKQKNL